VIISNELMKHSDLTLILHIGIVSRKQVEVSLWQLQRQHTSSSQNPRGFLWRSKHTNRMTRPPCCKSGFNYMMIIFSSSFPKDQGSSLLRKLQAIAPPPVSNTSRSYMPPPSQLPTCSAFRSRRRWSHPSHYPPRGSLLNPLSVPSRSPGQN